VTADPERVEAARRRFARVAFAEFLGVTVRELEPDRAVIVLPFAPEHMNARGVLQGGAGASLVTLAGTLAAWTGVDLAAEPRLRCVDCSIQYLSSSQEEDVTAEARTRRRGRDVIFLEVAVRSAAGRTLVHGALTYEAGDRAGHPERLWAPAERLTVPGPLVPPAEHRLFHGYVAKLGIAPVHQGPGRVRLSMPCPPTHVDEQGHVHAGALSSIVDIAAVAATWSLVPRRPGVRGSTIGMQVAFPGPAAGAVVADARVERRSESLFWSTVHVATADTGELAALGQVSYRLLEPWP
jgi:uncharacterized protein (TIGR00369 family)